MVSKPNRLGIHKVLFPTCFVACQLWWEFQCFFPLAPFIHQSWYFCLTFLLLQCYTQKKDYLPLSLSFPTTLHLISFSVYGSCPEISATHIDNSLSIIPLTEVGKCRDLLYAYNDRQLPQWHNLSALHLLQKQTYCARCLIVTIHHCSLSLWQSPRPLSL